MEHVAVARIAWGPRVEWPRGFDVHHIDGNRQHNCRTNLLILPECLHTLPNGIRKWHHATKKNTKRIAHTSARLANEFAF